MISAFLQKCKIILSSHLVAKQKNVSRDAPKSTTNFFDLQLLLLQSQQGTKQLVSSFPLKSPDWPPFQRALSPLRVKEWRHFPRQACSTGLPSGPPIPPSGQTLYCTRINSTGYAKGTLCHQPHPCCLHSLPLQKPG